MTMRKPIDLSGEEDVYASAPHDRQAKLDTGHHEIRVVKSSTSGTIFSELRMTMRKPIDLSGEEDVYASAPHDRQAKLDTGLALRPLLSACYRAIVTHHPSITTQRQQPWRVFSACYRL